MILKLLITIGIVLFGLWLLRASGRGQGRVPPKARQDRVPEAEDLVPCPRCGTYAPAGKPCPACATPPTP